MFFLSAWIAAIRKQNRLRLWAEPGQPRWRGRRWWRWRVWPQLSAERALKPQFIQVTEWALLFTVTHLLQPQAAAVPECVYSCFCFSSFHLWSFKFSLLRPLLKLWHVSFPPSWCLMRLAMVQLVLVNLKSFYPMAGYDLLGNCENTLHCLWRYNIKDGDKCCFILSCFLIFCVRAWVYFYFY